MVLGILTKEDRKHYIYFDEIVENILKNVIKKNQKYVKNQLDRLDKNFMDYICYWNEKYYGNGFCDVVELVSNIFLKVPFSRSTLALETALLAVLSNIHSLLHICANCVILNFSLFFLFVENELLLSVFILYGIP